MSPREFEIMLECLGRTPATTAELLHVSDRAVRRWLSGQRAVPFLVAAVLGLLLKRKIVAGDIVDETVSEIMRKLAEG